MTFKLNYVIIYYYIFYCKNIMDIEEKFSYFSNNLFNNFDKKNILFIGQSILFLHINDTNKDNIREICRKTDLSLEILVYGINRQEYENTISSIMEHIKKEIPIIYHIKLFNSNEKNVIKITNDDNISVYKDIFIYHTEKTSIDNILNDFALDILMIVFDGDKIIKNKYFDSAYQNKQIYYHNNCNFNDLLRLDKWGFTIKDGKFDYSTFFNGTKNNLTDIEKFHVAKLIPNEYINFRIKDFFMDNFYYPRYNYKLLSNNRASPKQNNTLCDVDHLGRSEFELSVIQNKNIIVTEYAHLFNLSIHGITYFHLICQYNNTNLIKNIMDAYPQVKKYFMNLKDVYDMKPYMYFIFNDNIDYFKIIYNSDDYDSCIYLSLILEKYNFLKFVYNKSKKNIISVDGTSYDILLLGAMVKNKKMIEYIYELGGYSKKVVESCIISQILELYMEDSEYAKIILILLNKNINLKKSSDVDIYLYTLIKNIEYEILKKMFTVSKFLVNYVIKKSLHNTKGEPEYMTPLSMVDNMINNNMCEVDKIKLTRLYTMIENCGGKLLFDCNIVNPKIKNYVIINNNKESKKSGNYSSNTLVTFSNIDDPKIIHSILNDDKKCLDNILFEISKKLIKSYHEFQTYYKILKIVEYYKPEWFNFGNEKRPIYLTCRNLKMFKLFLLFEKETFDEELLKQIIVNSNIEVLSYYCDKYKNIDWSPYMNLVLKFCNAECTSYMIELMLNIDDNKKENMFGMTSYDIYVHKVLSMKSNIKNMGYLSNLRSVDIPDDRIITNYDNFIEILNYFKMVSVVSETKVSEQGTSS